MLADAQFLAHLLLERGKPLGVHQVGLVDRDEEGDLFLVQVGDEALVLHGQAAGAVDHQDGHVGALAAAQGGEAGDALELVLDLGLAPDAGGVHENIVLAVLLEVHINGVAGGSGLFVDD